MNDNALLKSILVLPEVRIGLINFTIRFLDYAKEYLLKLRDSEILKIENLKKTNKLFD